ncbi:hypothetical protein EDB85DRAFT_2011487 [Lactarius pseudohatsudake]|nr:hypothetical protein EDB85DRAFT_2011487 [Lactarius pseudohatsudake]
MLLSYGANVDEEDRRGMTPFQVASSKGRHEIRHEMTKLLLEHGAVARRFTPCGEARLATVH